MSALIAPQDLPNRASRCQGLRDPQSLPVLRRGRVIWFSSMPLLRTESSLHVAHSVLLDSELHVDGPMHVYVAATPVNSSTCVKTDLKGSWTCLGSSPP